MPKSRRAHLWRRLLKRIQAIWCQLRWNLMGMRQRDLALVERQEIYIVRRRDAYIGRDIFGTGTYEIEKLIQVLGHLPLGHKHTRLIDVGANVGSICIPAVTRKMFHCSIAVEPEPTNFRLLQVNVILNDVQESIKCVQAAAGRDASTTLLLRLADRNFGDHQVVAEALPPDGPVVEVPTITLDGLAQDWDSMADLIWMDVQGFEAVVLQGAEGALLEQVPITMEFWPRRISEFCSQDQFLRLLRGYSKYVDLGAVSEQHRDISELPGLYRKHLALNSSTDLLFL